MDFIIEGYKKTGYLHHAYLIESDGDDTSERVAVFIENDLGISIIGNPDVWERSFEKFGIDEGRMLRDLQATKAFSKGKRIFIVVAQFFTHQAQNALLKVFEEPSDDTHFFIITPRADVLLPTLRSRFFIVSRKEGGSETAHSLADSSATAFLSGNIKERLGIIAPFIESKNKAEAIDFLNAIERSLYVQGEAFVSKHLVLFHDISQSRRYLYGNAPSVKLILEHLATAIPRME